MTAQPSEHQLRFRLGPQPHALPLVELTPAPRATLASCFIMTFVPLVSAAIRRIAAEAARGLKGFMRRFLTQTVPGSCQLAPGSRSLSFRQYPERLRWYPLAPHFARLIPGVPAAVPSTTGPGLSWSGPPPCMLRPPIPGKTGAARDAGAPTRVGAFRALKTVEATRPTGVRLSAAPATFPTALRMPPNKPGSP